jgi:phenylpyruvate tautomerase PptA (4-oxalocrotonate tautomerase family)
LTAWRQAGTLWFRPAVSFSANGWWSEQDDEGEIFMPIIQFDVAQEGWTSEQEKSLIRNITKAVQQANNGELDEHLVVFIRESPVQLNGAATLADGRVAVPAPPETTDANGIMREQLEYLINHIAEQGICGCSQCQRYFRTRSVLLEIFNEPQSRPAYKVAPDLTKVA